MKIKCMLDTKQFKKKPQGAEIGTITNRLEKSQIEINIEDLANKLVKGCTFKPALLNGKKETDWISQQLFALDFDDGTTIEDELNRCNELNILPVFGYTSFSHTEEHHKFRLVFCANEVITDYNTAKKLQLTLMNIFNNCDERCKNLSRLYFGGKNLIYSNYDNIIDYRDIIEKYPSTTIDNKGVGQRVPNILNEYNNLPNILGTLHPHSDKTIDNTCITTNDNYNIKALRNRDIEYLKNKINNKPIEFETVSEFWHYVYHNINMAELLEFKYPKSIKCLFHDDNNPSASIYQNNEGVWLYTCHGKCNMTMNIKQLIETLGNFKSEYKAIEFIKCIYNLSVKETQWSIEQKANLDSILHKLDMNVFAELCPQADKNIRYVKDLYSTMIQIAKDNIYGENYCNTDGDIVFFVSLSELAKIMKTAQNSLKRLSQRIAVLVYHDLIRKLDDDKIPDILLKKAQAISIDKGTDKRINFYCIPSWVFEHLKNVELQGDKWKQNGYTIKGVSYEMFYRAEGLEVAQHIYPQHKKVTKTIDGVKQIVDRTISKASDARVDNIVKAINYLIDKKGYTTEKDIIYILSNKYKYELTEIQLKKMRGQLEELGFKRIKSNKEIKNQYGITSQGYPFLIVKIN